MTSNRAKLQVLIDTLDSALEDPSTPEAKAQLQSAIAQTRRYLADLQREGADSPEASAQEVLQAVVQEMGYLRTNMIQPLREEITQLHDERKTLANSVRQLQQQQQHIRESQQQQMLRDFMQSLMGRLQDQMTTQVVQAISLMQPQLPTGGVNGEEFSQLSPAEQAEQLRLLQATSNELMLKMDATMRVVFDSLQTTVDSYRDSLGQGLEKMHSLGQQGEALFTALVNRLASQLGREASQYLSQSLHDGESFQLGGTGIGGDRLLPTVGPAAFSETGNAANDTPGAGTAAELPEEALSAEQIDQLLRQNLSQSLTEPSVEAGPAPSPQEAPPSQQTDSPETDELIDQILHELEADIDAIGNNLNLNLDEVDLAPPSPEADEVTADEVTADDDLEAIALFELAEDGVIVHESANLKAQPHAQTGPEPEPDSPAEDERNRPTPEGSASPTSSAEIAAFYAEFRAATEMDSDQTADSPAAEPAAEPTAKRAIDEESRNLAPSTVKASDDSGDSGNSGNSDAQIDTISRLSDLIDPNLLIQMGTEGISGTNSSFTMASLGEDLLATGRDSAKPSVDLDIDLDQLTADLSRIEARDGGIWEESLTASEPFEPPFQLPPDSEAQQDNPDLETVVPPQASAPSEALLEDTSPKDALPEDALPEDALPEDLARHDELEPFPDEDSTIDEIAALFAALENTEDGPSERATIAQQTLADLLKPASGGSFSTPPDDSADRDVNTEPEDDEKKK
ncbi:MAG: hypothetical protein ACFB4J_07480 [Elainellaceae cyanobacterium]